MCEKDCKLNNNKKVTPFSIWIPYLTKKQSKKYKWSIPETLGLWLLYNKIYEDIFCLRPVKLDVKQYFT